MNTAYDFASGLLSTTPTKSAEVPFNAAEYSMSLKHKGVMICRCQLGVGGQFWPLTPGVIHIDSRCSWNCCGDVWSIHNCRKLVEDQMALESKPVVVPPTAATAPGAFAIPSFSMPTFGAPAPSTSVTAPLARVPSVIVPPSASGFNIKSLRTAGFAEVDDVMSPPQILAASSAKPAVETAPVTTIPQLSEEEEAQVNVRIGSIEDFAPETGVACVGMFQNPLWFIGGDFLDQRAKPQLLTGKMDDVVFRKLIATNVANYQVMLNLDPTEKRNSEMLAAWLFAGCNTWIRVAGDNDIPTVPLTLKDSSNLYEFISEFEPDECGKFRHEEALRKAAVNGRISEQDYMDWYVICRYSEAIIPPVLSGCPIFTSAHNCSIASVLNERPELYEQFWTRKTAGGQTLDSFIQMGLDHPDCPVGLIAADECTYETFDEIVKEIVSKLTLAKAGPDVLVEGVEGEDSYMVPAPWGHGGRSNLQSTDLFISTDEATLANVSSFFLALTLKGMRNIRGYRFPGFCTRSERKSVEKILRAAITASNPGGNYVTGPNITSDMMSPSKEPWGGFFSSEWAESRLYFTNTANTVNMSVNHEDHLSVQVTGTWGTFMAAEIFEEYAASIQGVERELNEAGYQFVRDNTYGYHTSYPQNMGTGLTATVELFLPLLMTKGPEPVFQRLGLAFPRPNKTANGICELMCILRIGVSEVEQVQTLIDGANVLMSLEAMLTKGDVGGCSETMRRLAATFVGPSVMDPPGLYETDVTYEPSSWEDAAPDDFPTFSKTHSSAVAKVLTKSLYKELATTTKTAESQGWSLDLAIRGAVNCPETPVGMLLGGESSYEAYSPVLVPLISLLHSGFSCTNMVQPAIDPNLRDLNYWINHSENVTSPYILSASISASRNIFGFPMVPAADRKSKRSVDFVMKSAFLKKNKELKGVYTSMNDISPAALRMLELDEGNILPPAPVAGTPRALVGGQRDGKDGCGYFRSTNDRVHAWVNDEDHLKLFVRDDGHKAYIPAAVDLKFMIKEWARALVLIENVMEPSGFCFMHSERLGYVTSCPSNLGTAMRLKVTVNLAALKLSATEAQVMGKDLNILFEPSKSVEMEGVWDLTNIVTLGYTEVEILENFFFGLVTIIEFEQKATGIITPVLGPIAVFGSLNDEELKYIKQNELTGAAVVKVTRTPMPAGSILKYAGRVDITSKRALEGAWINKKLAGNMFQANRYLWIDHLTKSLHWAKTSDKLAQHKALSLESVLKIGITPRTTLEVMGATVSGKSKTYQRGGEARFDLPANSIRLHLSGLEKYKDIHLPPGITIAEREDWITILSDCCGFKSRQSAVNGRSEEDRRVLGKNPREFTFGPRDLATPTKAPNVYGRKSLSLNRGLSIDMGSFSPGEPVSPVRSMSPQEELFFAEQDTGGNPADAITLRVAV